MIREAAAEQAIKNSRTANHRLCVSVVAFRCAQAVDPSAECQAREHDHDQRAEGIHRGAAWPWRAGGSAHPRMSSRSRIRGRESKQDENLHRKIVSVDGAGQSRRRHGLARTHASRQRAASGTSLQPRPVRWSRSNREREANYTSWRPRRRLRPVSSSRKLRPRRQPFRCGSRW